MGISESRADTEQKRKSAAKEIPTASRRHTRGMTMDAARKAVLNTSELLESILVFLPPKTLFGVQRVSKQFQAIIATSVPIQEKMFLRFRNKSQESWLLKEKITPTDTDRYFVECTKPSPDLTLRKPTELNPFLGLNVHFEDRSCADRAWRGRPEHVNLVLGKPMSLAMLRTAPPSVLKPYICDPPSEDINVHYHYRFPQGGIVVFQDKVEGAESIRTMGDIIRNALEGEHGRASIAMTLEMLNTSPNYTRWAMDAQGDVLHPSLAVQKYEYMLNATAELETGIMEVYFSIRDMVIPTEDERAAVKSRDKEG